MHATWRTGQAPPAGIFWRRQFVTVAPRGVADVASASMNQSEIKAILKRVENLSDFAKRAKLPLRTLDRLKNGDRPATVVTLQAVTAALRKHKPVLLPEPTEADPGA